MTNTKLCIFILIVISLFGCNEVFEASISNETVIIKSPKKNHALPAGNIQFWWEQIDDATEYQMQIVKGTFDNPIRLVLDIDTPTNVVEQLLLPGNYEWRVKAKNSTSETPFKSQTLQVDSIIDIQTIDVQLLEPSTDACLNDSSLIFAWQAISIPNIKYEFKLVIGEFETGDLIDSYETLETNVQIDISSSMQGELSWGVRVKLDGEGSAFTKRAFKLDNSEPLPPILFLPNNNDSLSTNLISFSWVASVEETCTEKDSLFIYDENQNGDLLQSFEMKSESSMNVTLSSGHYSWQVLRYDAAQNGPSYSPLWFFYVQ